MSRSVDQAGCSTIFAVKATVLPSGDQENSSAPPNGFVGLSASTPFIRSTGPEPSGPGQTKIWLRLWSSHVSQCLNSSEV